MILKNFPRGGKKPLNNSTKKISLKPKKVKNQNQKPRVISENGAVQKDEPLVLNTAQNLRVTNLREGMKILGRIFKVTDYYAVVSLPGQITAKLQTTDLGESYTNLLKSVANNEEVTEEFKPMSSLYKEGEYIVSYVKELDIGSGKILVSIEPQFVNENINPATLTKRSKIALVVSSIEDHGYVLETGVKKFRAFLPIKDIKDEESKYYPGKQIICAIKDINLSENVYTAKVSVKPKHLDCIDSNISSLDNMVPGTQFSLTVKNVLKDGLQVYYGENNVGYINQLYIPNSLTSYEKGQEIVGTLLYIIPALKFAYFSLIPNEHEKRSLAVGDIITKAKVLSRDSRGIILFLKKNVRGFIPLKRTEVEFDKISTVFTPDSTHKCKIIAYDFIGKFYVCSMEKKVLEEKQSSVDLRTGNKIKVTVEKINENGYITVKAGKVLATVPPEEVTDPGLVNNLKSGQTVEARVLSSTTEKVWVTLKKSLIESNLPILTSVEEAKADSTHDGTVINISKNGVLVRFFNNIKGLIPKFYLNPQTASLNWNVVVGQTITTIIKKVNLQNNRITLSLIKNKKKAITKYKIGDTVEGIVTDSTPDGVHIQLKNDGEDVAAFLPSSHMSPCPEVGKILATKIVAGDKLSAKVFSKNPSIILSTIFAPEKIYKIEDLNTGDLIICSVVKIHKDNVKVLLPISNCSKYGTIPNNKFDSFESVYKHQILFGKITKIDKKTGDIQLTAELSKVWKSVSDHDVKMMTAVDVLSCYLNKLNELSNNIYFTNKKITKFNLGQRIEGIVENVMDNGLLLKLEGDVKGIVRPEHYSKKYKQGDKVEGSVLWISHIHEYIEITLLNKFMNSINKEQSTLEKIPIASQLRGEIVLVTNWFVLAVLKGQQGMGTLVTLPVKRHLNDMSPSLTPYTIGDKLRCYGILNKDDANILLPICLFKSAFESHHSDADISANLSLQLKRKSKDSGSGESGTKKKFKKSNDNEDDGELQKPAKKNEKRKKGTKNEDKDVNSENSKNQKSNKRKIVDIDHDSDSDNSVKEEKKVKIKKSSEQEVKSENKNGLNLFIPEIGFKWDNSVDVQPSESSSSEDEELDQKVKSKKKKMSSAERRELERQKEREIREREELLASSAIPQSVDQFDRLVLSSPDNSLVWIQYMTFHLQATEIDKARTVARRALKTINFREEDEKLNVWQAWMNLESRFGSPESLQEVFQEAVKTNDAEKVYLHMLNVHIDASRPAELQKIVSAMIAKFKPNPDTWINCGTAYYKIGMKEKSRHLLERALQALPANKHVDVIVRFAQLENKFGEKERSQTLFEQILTSYPKRTDVWSSYVDSLAKSDQIDIARKVLDRAITQNLPVKKMRTLFKKYLSFEEKYGTPENVSRVRELAANYVEKHSSS